ncbi:MAG TPA: type I-MYXAN CRISPR-associated protein Cas6/Cmx6 [Blastocatellia bacterium]|nr:type I-MYXAN CRISPR-associated protein Cas6/Cmx6 [Blastocatellia bacterium]
MVLIELKFPVIGTTVPSDHGYLMFSAVSRAIPEVHGADWIAVETIPGHARGDGATQLNQRARFKVRVPQDRVPLMLKLAGKRLEVGGHQVRLGIPRASLLIPSSTLYARCVTIKHYTEPEPFLGAVIAKLDEIAVDGEPEVGARRAFRVGNHTIVGFSLTLRGLSEEASLMLQEKGMGGRRHFGCGYFLAVPNGTQRFV